MAEVQLNTFEIKKALEHNAEFLIQFFLQEELTRDVPEFHKDIFYDMTTIDDDRLGIAIPRDHAKTTLAKLAVVWYFLFTDYRFIMYVSNTVSIAIPAVNDIVTFLSSENFQAVFGEVEWITRQDGKGIYKFKLGDKVCILRAHGAGQQVRGINIDNKRPQLAIIDDLEDNNNIATPELFMKLKRWFYGPFVKALDKFDNKIIWLGNMISRNSMLYENCESQYWTTKRYGAILEDGTPLWPDAWPIEKLRKDFRQYQEAGLLDVWFAEMMNLPIAAGGGIIAANEITYAPAIFPEDADFTFITVDLAISSESWAHKTTVTVHAFTGERYQVVQCDGFHGMDPIVLFNYLVTEAFRWNVTCIGIENVAYQDSLQYVYPHMCRMQEIEGLIFVPLSAQGHKAQRIITWAGQLKAGDYVLTQGDIVVTEELLNYDPSKPKGNKDDHIDGAAYGPQMTDRYMNEIMQSRTYNQHGKATSGYAISSV